MELWTGSLCAAVISRRVGVDLPNPPSHNEQMNEIEIFFLLLKGSKSPSFTSCYDMNGTTDGEGGRKSKGGQGGRERK